MDRRQRESVAEGICWALNLDATISAVRQGTAIPEAIVGRARTDPLWHFRVCGIGTTCQGEGHRTVNSEARPTETLLYTLYNRYAYATIGVFPFTIPAQRKPPYSSVATPRF